MHKDKNEILLTLLSENYHLHCFDNIQITSYITYWLRNHMVYGSPSPKKLILSLYNKKMLTALLQHNLQQLCTLDDIGVYND